MSTVLVVCRKKMCLALINVILNWVISRVLAYLYSSSGSLSAARRLVDMSVRYKPKKKKKKKKRD